MVGKRTRNRLLGGAAVVASILFLRLLVLVMLIIPVFLRRSWNTSAKHDIGGAVTVVRVTHVIRFGFPLQCADLRWHEWSATKTAQPIKANDEDLRRFAGLEYFAVLDGYFLRSFPAHSLDYKSARREELLLRTDPRACNLVVRWGLLSTNAAACYMAGGLLFYWKHKRRLKVAEHRRKSGRCGNCGYDLTGNVSGICPECGAAVGDTKVGV